MFNSNTFSPQPLTPRRPAIGYWLGLILALVGDALLIIAYFSPWLEVFKVDPSLPIPKRGYSPWIVLQRGFNDALGVAAGVFLLLILGLLITTFILASKAVLRARASYILIVTVVMALMGLFTVGITIMFASLNLSLNYPYYDTNVMYGGGLASIGFLVVLTGSVFLALRS